MRLTNTLARTLLLSALAAAFSLSLTPVAAYGQRVSRGASAEAAAANERRQARVNREGAFRSRVEMHYYHTVAMLRRAAADERKRVPQPSAKAKKLLVPLPEDRERYAEFLRQPDTGMVRLLPKGRYELKKTVSADALSDGDLFLMVKGAGAYFSFTKKKHSADIWSEIFLDANAFHVGFAFQTLGMLTVLGDVPLEAVTPEAPGVAPLLKFNPPQTSTAAAEKFQQVAQGLKSDSFIFRTNYPATPNTTYVLRSIGYGRADTVIAFRVVNRSEDDGGYTILWKRLKKFKAPPLHIDGKT